MTTKRIFLRILAFPWFIFMGFIYMFYPEVVIGGLEFLFDGDLKLRMSEHTEELMRLIDIDMAQRLL